MKKILATLVLVLSLVLGGLAQTDQYGGLTALPSPNGGTGYFRVEKINNRWMFVSPDGNGFFLFSVYGINGYDGGTVYSTAIQNKYNDTTYVAWGQSVKRAKTFGFNTVGEYASTYANPLPMYGHATGCTEKAPFIALIKIAGSTMRYGYVKDIFDGLPSTYTGYRGSLVDAFDPAFAPSASSFLSSELNNYTGGAAAVDASPWLVALSVDDADQNTGLVNGGHAHPAWLIAVAPPVRYTSTKYKDSTGAYITYTDGTLYSKVAWKDFLANKYGSISALDSAWGATYGTWDDVLNEDGSSPWLKTTDFYNLSNLSPTVRGDLDAFLYEFSLQYAKVITTVARTYLPHHLISTPASIKLPNRPQVWAAFKQYFDIFQVNSLPNVTGANYLNELSSAYDQLGKPIFLWTIFGSNPDSPLSAYTIGAQMMYPTQEDRGAAYAAYLDAVYNVKGGDGVAPILGIDWWAWVDKVVGGEHANFGLVTYTKDNAYDGIEDRVATGVDQWGYPVGGETTDYGDFISYVRQAHAKVVASLTNTTTTPPPPPPPPPTIDPPIISTFDCSPNKTRLGRTVKCSVATTNTDQCSVDQGIGSVPVNGTFSFKVSIRGTVTYTLSCSNAGGTSTAQDTLQVK